MKSMNEAAAIAINNRTATNDATSGNARESVAEASNSRRCTATVSGLHYSSTSECVSTKGLRRVPPAARIKTCSVLSTSCAIEKC